MCSDTYLKCSDFITIVILLTIFVLFGTYIFAFAFFLMAIRWIYDVYNILFTEPQREEKKKKNKPDYKAMFMSKADKKRYMQSDKWKELKQLALLLSANKCTHCGSANNLVLHHITYDRLGHEDMGDVVILCKTCHSKLHEMIGYSRDGYYPINMLKLKESL